MKDNPNQKPSRLQFNFYSPGFHPEPNSWISFRLNGSGSGSGNGNGNGNDRDTGRGKESEKRPAEKAGIIAGQRHRMGGHNVQIMLEGNSRGLASGWQAAVLAQFRFNVEQPPAFYPYSDYLTLVEYLRTKLYPSLQPDEAYQKLGYAASLAYFNGVSGQVLKVAARVMGPVRGAKQFVNMMRLALPWDKHELVEVRTGYVCYSKTFSGGSPALMLGFIQASLETAGGKLTRLSYRFDPPLSLSLSSEMGNTLSGDSDNNKGNIENIFSPQYAKLYEPVSGVGAGYSGTSRLNRFVYHEIEWV